MKYLFISCTFLLPHWGGWPLTFSCYSTGLWLFVTEAISLTPVFT